MKILVLEDNPERIKSFKKHLKFHDVYYFDNVKEAQEAVNLIGPFEMYFLDHDLDNKIFVSSTEQNTGYQFAKFLSTKNIKADIVIHSLNIVGASNMKSVLPTAQIIPFSTLF